MFLNFELFLFPSKTLTLFKEYSEINNIILLQNSSLCLFCMHLCSATKELQQQIGIRAIDFFEILVS